VDFVRHWREIGAAFFRLGATSYGGPAIMGVMQAELQERRQWLSQPRFVEGLALVVRAFTWTRAMLRGMSPAVIGLLAVSLTRLAPYALVDPLAVAMFVATVAALLLWRPGTVRLMLGGAVLGALRHRWFPLPGLR